MHIHCIPIYPYTGSGQKCREKHCKTHFFCRFVYKFIPYSSSFIHRFCQCDVPKLSRKIMIFSMGFVVILQVIQVILPRQTLRAIHRDQRQQRAVDASRLSCDHERTPRTAKMMVIGSRRIPPDTLLTKSIHSNIPVTLGLNMCYIYIHRYRFINANGSGINRWSWGFSSL